MTTAYATKTLTGWMTSNQKSYLEALLVKFPGHEIAGQYTLLNSAGMVTKQQASAWISTLSTLKVQPTAPITVDTLSKLTDTGASYIAAKPAYGIYAVTTTISNGNSATTYYNFVEKSVNGHKTSVLMRLSIKTKIEWDPATQQHKQVQVGSWKKCGTTPTAKKLLAGLTAFTLQEAKDFGHKFGFCAKCGRYLSDPVSVSNGLGPICIKDFM